jgi:hypothetical protein
MSDVAIRVENLSKLYHIGRAQQRHDTLRDALTAAFKRSNVPTFKRPEMWYTRAKPIRGQTLIEEARVPCNW